MTFRIVTDSTADLSEDYLQKYDIAVLGMTVTIGEQTYPTIGENSLSNEHLLREIKAGKTVQTSQIQKKKLCIWPFHQAYQVLINLPLLLEK